MFLVKTKNLRQCKFLRRRRIISQLLKRSVTSPRNLFFKKSVRGVDWESSIISSQARLSRVDNVTNAMFLTKELMLAAKANFGWSKRLFIFEQLLGQWNTGASPNYWWSNLLCAFIAQQEIKTHKFSIETDLELNLEALSKTWQIAWRVRTRKISRRMRKIVRNAYRFTVTYELTPPKQRRKIAYRLYRIGLSMAGATSLRERLHELFEPALDTLPDTVILQPTKIVKIEDDIEHLSEDTTDTHELVEANSEPEVHLPILTKIDILAQRSQTLALLAKVRRN